MLPDSVPSKASELANKLNEIRKNLVADYKACKQELLKGIEIGAFRREHIGILERKLRKIYQWAARNNRSWLIKYKKEFLEEANFILGLKQKHDGEAKLAIEAVPTMIVPYRDEKQVVALAGNTVEKNFAVIESPASQDHAVVAYSFLKSKMAIADAAEKLIVHYDAVCRNPTYIKELQLLKTEKGLSDDERWLIDNAIAYSSRSSALVKRQERVSMPDLTEDEKLLLQLCSDTPKIPQKDVVADAKALVVATAPESELQQKLKLKNQKLKEKLLQKQRSASTAQPQLEDSKKSGKGAYVLPKDSPIVAASGTKPAAKDDSAASQAQVVPAPMPAALSHIASLNS
jgi:Holliday junction resolvase